MSSTVRCRVVAALASAVLALLTAGAARAQCNHGMQQTRTPQQVIIVTPPATQMQLTVLSPLTPTAQLTGQSLRMRQALLQQYALQQQVLTAAALQQQQQNAVLAALLLQQQQNALVARLNGN